jgi:hypothetical protein
VEPTARPSRRRPGRPWRLRGRLGALAALAVLVTAGMAIAPSAAYADPGEPHPPVTVAPCSSLGPIDWWYYYQSGPYARAGVRYIIISTSTVFEPAHGRFIENTTDQTFTGTWTATETRTVTFTTSFTLTIASTAIMRTTITLAAGVQVVETRTTQLGVSATSQIPPHRTMLGEYGLHSLDVVMDVQTVAMRQDMQTCEFVPSNVQRHTAHAPTINEGWRFTLF